jgi:hypothetical protein
MPWQSPGFYRYNEDSVAEHAPATSGVYGLYNTQSWVYIGEASNIQEALLQNKTDPCITRNGPTAFVFEICPAELRARRREDLIVEFKPACNAMLYEVL